MTYSTPYAEPTRYTIFPTGYREAPKDVGTGFCIFVERFPDTGRWYVHDGFRRVGQIVTHTGKWVDNVPLNRQWTRFDNAEDAIAVALKAVDTRPFRDLVKWIESPRGREIVAMREE